MVGSKDELESCVAAKREAGETSNPELAVLLNELGQLKLAEGDTAGATQDFQQVGTCLLWG